MAKMLLLFWTLVAVTLSLDPDAEKDMIELVSKHGYPIDQHFIQTDDGYILGCFRIPYGIKENSNARDSGKPVVLLQHGLLDSSYTWISNPTNESLGYLLADAGYDVWLGNNRGNTWSKQHVTYKTHTEQFWNFSYDEMAKYDVPNQIEYILEYTNKSTLGYVGHSEGTTQVFATSYFSDVFNEKVAWFGALGPAAWVYYTESPLLKLMAELHIDTLFELLGVKQFLPGIYGIDKFAPPLCDKLDHACDLFLEFICGPTTNLNESRIEVYVSATPADTSVKNMAHWAQGVRRNNFEMFDYGTPERNKEHYGPDHPEPPQYNVSKLTAPMSLYSGSNDWLADPQDVKHLVSLLDTNAIINQTEVDGYAHLDFVWAYNAVTIIYNDIIKNLNKFVGPGKIIV